MNDFDTCEESCGDEESGEAGSCPADGIDQDALVGIAIRAWRFHGVSWWKYWKIPPSSCSSGSMKGFHEEKRSECDLPEGELGIESHTHTHISSVYFSHCRSAHQRHEEVAVAKLRAKYIRLDPADQM